MRKLSEDEMWEYRRPFAGKPTALQARLPAPVQPEARPMTPYDGVGLDNRDCVQPLTETRNMPDEE
jgi:hypothetical protein